MGSQESGRIAASLVHRAGQNANAAQIAAALGAIWQEIEAGLTPIIGQRGVAALYKRSLYLASARHPWLDSLHEGVDMVIDLAPLKAVTAKQGAAAALAGGETLLHNLDELLTSLVGPALTERLLLSVSANVPNPIRVQDDPQR